MRLFEVFKDFLKIFISIKKTKSVKNYSTKVKDWSLSKSQFVEKKFILKQINFYKKNKILDYGCNDCSFSNIVTRKFLYWGVDNNPELLKKSIKKHSKNFKFLKNSKIPFKKNSFDCILISHVIAHVKDTKTLFKNLQKVLSSNGIIILVTPNKYYKFFYFFRNIFNNYQPDQTIIKLYSLSDSIKLLEKNNFEVIKYYKFSVKKNEIISDYLNSRILVIAKKVMI